MNILLGGMKIDRKRSLSIQSKFCQESPSSNFYENSHMPEQSSESFFMTEIIYDGWDGWMDDT